MRKLICIPALIFSIACFGQTRLIAHRSHSGSDATFRMAIEHNLFDSDNSNFGIVAIYVSQIDSVVLKGNDKIIILRKTYYKNYSQNKPVFLRDTVTKAANANLFAAASNDELKAELRKTYKTALMDSTLFIGFRKQFKQKK